MKKLLLSSALLLISFLGWTQAIVLEYDVKDLYIPYNRVILPLSGSVDVTVDWGDGSSIETFKTAGLRSHTYSTTGIKTVTIKGSLSHFGSDEYLGVDYSLKKILQWDIIGLTSLSKAFQGAFRLVEVPDTLPSRVTDLSHMFFNCNNFNQPIGNWNTSNVTDMSYMFCFADSFNQPVGNWNTSNVADMSYMFYDANTFNQPIGDWNTSNVTDMRFMFYYAYAFNQPIGDWNTSNVTDMRFMFYNAHVFNQPIGDWNTSNVTNMSAMFCYKSVFNQPIESWNTSNVTNMSAMFSLNQVFNQPIGDWNTSNVTDMSFMFAYSSVFNQPIEDWNTSNVIDMSGMFENATSFNQPIGNWNTSKVLVMSIMFDSAVAFNQNIANWDIDSVIYIYGMFRDTKLCTENYDALLNGWAPQMVKSGVSFHGGNSKYSANSENARLALINKGWTITDAGEDADGSNSCIVSGITSSKNQSKTNLYPNPARNSITLSLDKNLQEDAVINIYSTTGLLLQESKVDFNGSEASINIQNLEKGAYIVKLNTGNETFVQSFIKE